MRWALLFYGLMLVLVSCRSETTSVDTNQNMALFRYLSYVVRDHPPSIQEAKDFYNGVTELDDVLEGWLTEGTHLDRVERFWLDRFGAYRWTELVEREFILTYNDDNVLTMSNKTDCTLGTSQLVDAWWTTKQVRMCPDSINSSLTENSVNCAQPQGVNEADCGCGPQQIICLPPEHSPNFTDGIIREIGNRASYAYSNNLTWKEFLGGDNFIGNRWAYHYYLRRQKLEPDAEMPSADELATLLTLPETSAGIAPMPSGPERSGVATSPIFLIRFNNFRSRVRALVSGLLCQDVNAALNLDGITEFINSDLGETQIEHGANPNCSSCHYPLDNMGSTLLGWNDVGRFQSWASYSQVGHSFGQRGTGPKFLINSFIDYAPGFHRCMAESMWEDFSGEDWHVLAPTDKKTFLEAAETTPRSLLQTILKSEALKKLRPKQ